MTQKKKNGILVLVAVLAVVLMGSVWFVMRPQGTAGEKNICITVVDAEGNSQNFEFSTSQEFLRGALEEQQLVEGEESEYGLFVKTVNGVTADDAKQQWWCFTKGGQELLTGVDDTPVADGDRFEATLKTGY